MQAAGQFAERWSLGLDGLTDDLVERGQSLCTVAGAFEDADATMATAATCAPGVG